MLFMVMVMVRITFCVWLVVGYAHIFIFCFIVIVP